MASGDIRTSHRPGIGGAVRAILIIAFVVAASGGECTPARASATASTPVGAPSEPTTAGPDTLALTLRRAIAIALAENPRVRIAGQEMLAAEARSRGAGQERWPRLTLTSGFYRHLDQQRLAPALRPSEPATLGRDLASSDLLLTFPLYTSGRLAGRAEAAKLLWTSARHHLNRTKEQTTFDVTRAFVGTLAQERVIESVSFSVTVLEEHLRQIDALLAAQKAARVDRLRTEVRLAETRELLLREKSGLALQRQVLVGLLGLEREAETMILVGDLVREDLTRPPQARFEDQVDSLVAVALARRSDLRAANLELGASARQVDALRADGRPSLALQAAYGGRYAPGDVSRIGDADRIDDLGRIGLALDIPIFDAGRVGSRVRAERATTEAARERMRDLRLQIRSEITGSLVEVESARGRIAVTAKAVEQSMEVLRIERLKYELGQGTILDVLDAQSMLLTSQTLHSRALADYRIGQARLRLATGEDS